MEIQREIFVPLVDQDIADWRRTGRVSADDGIGLAGDGGDDGLTALFQGLGGTPTELAEDTSPVAQNNFRASKLLS